MRSKRTVSFILLFFMLFTLCFQETFVYSSSKKEQYSNWPLIRMDEDNSAFTQAKYPDNMEFTDFLPVHSYHAPIVANNCYFLIEWETNEVHCYSIETKELLWNKSYSGRTDSDLKMGNVIAFSVHSNQLILLETIKGNWKTKTGFVSCVYSLNPENGDIHWKTEIVGYYANSLMIGDKAIYAKLIDIDIQINVCHYVSDQHKLYSVNSSTGEINWSSANMQGGEFYSIANVPALCGDYIVSTSSHNFHRIGESIAKQKKPCYVTLLNRHNGTIISTSVLSNYVGIGIPLIYDNKIFVVTSALFPIIPNFLISFEIKNDALKLLRKMQLSEKSHQYIYYANLAGYYEYMYFLDYSGLLLCINSETGGIKWKKKIGTESLLGPFFCNEEYLIVCSKYDVGNDSPFFKDNSYICLQYIKPLTGEVLFKNTVRFTGVEPTELTGTDGHIWAVCGGKIAHFSPAPPLSLVVSPLTIDVTCMEGETEKVERMLKLTKEGQVRGTIKCSEEWIQTDSNKINEHTETISVQIDPTDMPVGTFQGVVQVNSNGGNYTVTVRLTILEKPKLFVSPDSVTLTIIEGSTPEPTLFFIENIGGKGLQGIISEDIDWLSSTETMFTDEPCEFSVNYVTADLKPGLYKGTIEVSSTGGEQSIPIVLTVLQKPFLVVQPMTIVKEVAIGSSETVVLTLTNTGAEGLFGKISSNKKWLLPGIDTYDDDTDTVLLSLNAHDLKAGTYNGEVTFTGNNQVVTVSVTLKCIVWITFQIGSKTVIVNKVEETISAAPYLFQRRSYVPVRKLVESLPVLNYLKNAGMTWDPKERKVTIYVEEKTIELWVDNPLAKVNGEETLIDSYNSSITPQIREGRTFLPLRFIGENLGYKVEWVASTKTIHLKYIVDGE